MKIVAQLEHDQLTPSGLMVHDHHPAAPAPPTRLMASTRPTAEVLPGVATVWDGLVAMVVGNGVPIAATSQ